jgi:hypothetical protein
VLLNSKQIHCKTFDQLRDDILDRLEQFSAAARVEAREGRGEGISTETGHVSKLSEDDFAAGIYD